MRQYDTITEAKSTEQILKQYLYTTALDTFIITVVKGFRSRYNVYVSRQNYGIVHFVIGIDEEDYDILTNEAIDYIQHLEKEIADGTTDC